MIKNLLRKYKNNFTKFDKVTNFRLLNSFLVALGLSLFSPALIALKGQYLAAWAISMFMILSTLSVKLNKFFTTKYDINLMYRLGVLTHILFVIVSVIYFISPVTMIILDSVISIFETAVFSSYSILLTNYLTEKYPKHMQEFQVVRNSTWADGFLIGLSISMIVSYFYGIEGVIISFTLYNSIFAGWLLYNWNFFKFLTNK